MKWAKSRVWTESEVQHAIAEMRKVPNLWDEIERIEKTTGDFTGTEVDRQERRIMSRLHPECELNEVTDLYIAIRKYRRAQLGLK